MRRDGPRRLAAPALLLALLAALPAARPAPAAPEPRSQPVRILADQAEVDKKAQTSTYTGHVELTQGDLRLQAERLVVTAPGGRLRRVEASGAPARIEAVTPDGRHVTGSARELRYDPVKGELVLRGDGRLTQDGNTIHNDRIVFDLASGRLRAGGRGSGSRVEVILQPPAAEEPAP